MPSRTGEIKGPSRWQPITRGPTFPCGTERRGELVLGSRDERRLERRHARPEQRFPGAAVSLGVRRREVDAGEAVDVQVDEPRDGDTAAGRAEEAYGGDAAVLDLDVAGHESPVDERRLDADPHDVTLRRGAAERLPQRAKNASCK